MLNKSTKIKTDSRKQPNSDGVLGLGGGNGRGGGMMKIIGYECSFPIR